MQWKHTASSREPRVTVPIARPWCGQCVLSPDPLTSSQVSVGSGELGLGAFRGQSCLSASMGTRSLLIHMCSHFLRTHVTELRGHPPQVTVSGLWPAAW